MGCASSNLSAAKATPEPVVLKPASATKSEPKQISFRKPEETVEKEVDAGSYIGLLEERHTVVENHQQEESPAHDHQKAESIQPATSESATGAASKPESFAGQSVTNSEIIMPSIPVVVPAESNRPSTEQPVVTNVTDIVVPNTSVPTATESLPTELADSVHQPTVHVPIVDHEPIIQTVVVTPIVVTPTPTITVAAAAVATPKVPETKRGFMLKQGHVVKNWKNRYFILEAGTFSYYESASRKEPFGVNKKGDFPLKNAKMKSDGNIVTLSDSNNSTELLLDIKNTIDKVAWMVALDGHIEYANKL